MAGELLGMIIGALTVSAYITLAPPPATIVQIRPFGFNTVNFKDALVCSVNTRIRFFISPMLLKGKFQFPLLNSVLGWRDLMNLNINMMTHKCNNLFIQRVNETFCWAHDSSKRQRKLNVIPPECIKIHPWENTLCELHLKCTVLMSIKHVLRNKHQDMYTQDTNIKICILFKVLKRSSVIQFAPHIQGIWLPVHQCEWIHLYETEVKIYKKKIKRLGLNNISVKKISHSNTSDDQKVKQKRRNLFFFNNKNYQYSIFFFKANIKFFYK